MSKATLHQLLIVVCSVVSDVTPAPTLKESPHCDEDAGGGCIATPPHPCATAAPAPYPAPQRGSSFCSPPHYSDHAKPRRSAAWLMINAAGCGAKSSPFGGAVVPVRWRARRRRPGPCSSTCGGSAKGAAPSSGVGGGGASFAARLPPPSCWAEYASVTAGRTPGDKDQDLHRSEAWLGKGRCLAGVIRAVLAGSPPQAHCRGRGRGEHLARPWHGAGRGARGGMDDGT
jgi:hypothetical protein